LAENLWNREFAREASRAKLSNVELTEALREARHLRGPRVLCDGTGKALTQRVVQVLMRRTARRANVKPGIHILRHSFCSHLAMRGAPARAMDFRTWAGTVLAAKALARVARFTSAAQAKRNILRAVDEVATCLGNTRAVCRKSYIHPAIFDAYMDGAIASASRELRQLAARQDVKPRALSAEEAAVVVLLERGLRKTA
jgi:DNA topoisomerase IB